MSGGRARGLRRLWVEAALGGCHKSPLGTENLQAPLKSGHGRAGRCAGGELNPALPAPTFPSPPALPRRWGGRPSRPLSSAELLRVGFALLRSRRDSAESRAGDVPQARRGSAALRVPSPAPWRGSCSLPRPFLLPSHYSFITPGAPPRGRCTLSTSQAPRLQGRGLNLRQMSPPGCSASLWLMGCGPEQTEDPLASPRDGTAGLSRARGSHGQTRPVLEPPWGQSRASPPSHGPAATPRGNGPADHRPRADRWPGETEQWPRCVSTCRGRAGPLP